MPITPNQKQKIRQQARKQARKAFRPDIRAARKNLQKTKQQRARDLSGVERSSEYLRNALDQAMGNVNPKLKGGNLQDVMGELTAMKGDAARMVPLEQSAIRQSYADPLASARSSLAGLKMDRATAAQDQYASRITDIKERQAGAASDRQEAQKARTQEIRLAVDEGSRLLTMASDEERAALASGDEAAWANFAGLVAKREGVNSPQALRRAIERLQAQLTQPYQQAGRVIARTARNVAGG